MCLILIYKPYMTRNLPDLVLWDMDGTLIDQTPSIIRCYREVFSQLGDMIPNEDAIKRSLGGPLKATLSEFLPPEKVEPAQLLFRQLFTNTMFEGMRIMDGASELIEKLDVQNISQAILTNKQGDNARKVSAFCGFDTVIKVCIGHGDNAYQKPDPKFTQEAIDCFPDCKKLESIVLIGDSPTDVQTALNYKITSFAVATGAHSIQELSESGAHYTFSSIEAITDYWKL